MKPIIQKLPLNAETSFIAKTFRTPHFEVGWHQHVEYELILFTESHGLCFIGNYVGEFKAGDVFFIGSNVPHTFQKKDAVETGSAIVVQFRDDFWGSGFLTMPETNALIQLFSVSLKGIKAEGTTRETLADLLKKLEHAQGFLRITILCQCLLTLLQVQAPITLSTRPMVVKNDKYKQRLDNTFQYTITNFQQPISLEKIAGVANMSVTAFCAYFKKSTKKSYIEFLNEIRIGYACTQLQDTDKPIIDICYESGFNTAVNFNKQFLKLKKMAPGKYRNNFMANSR